jgi:hypothetical protein
MRSLFLVVVCGLLAWAFLRFFPHGETLAPEAGSPPAVQAPAEPEPTAAAEAGPAPALEAVAQTPASAPKSGPFAPAAVPGVLGPVAPAVHDLAASFAYGRPEATLLEQLNLARPALAAPSAALASCFIDGLFGRVEASREKAAQLHGNGLLGDSEQQLLGLFLGVQTGTAAQIALPETNNAHETLLRGLCLALSREIGRRQATAQQLLEASSSYTDLLRGLLDSGWPMDAVAMEAIMVELRELQKQYRWNPKAPWAAVELVVEPGDSLIKLRKKLEVSHPGLRINTELIQRVNGLKSDVLQPGMKLRVPTDPVHVLVDVDKRWLLYFIGEQVVDGWQVGVGKPGEETLLGEFVIGTKQPEPMHFPRGKKEVPYGHPDNPLGTHWLAWRRPDAPKEEKDLSYGFHGTWEDETVGQAASQGCVRMTNEKVLQLFQTLPVGARVIVRA